MLNEEDKEEYLQWLKDNGKKVSLDSIKVVNECLWL